MSGDLFSRSAMKRKARKAPEDGGDGWTWAGLLIVLAVIVVTVQNCGG